MKEEMKGAAAIEIICYDSAFLLIKTTQFCERHL